MVKSLPWRGVIFIVLVHFTHFYEIIQVSFKTSLRNASLCNHWEEFSDFLVLLRTLVAILCPERTLVTEICKNLIKAYFVMKKFENNQNVYQQDTVYIMKCYEVIIMKSMCFEKKVKNCQRVHIVWYNLLCKK